MTQDDQVLVGLDNIIRLYESIEPVNFNITLLSIGMIKEEGNEVEAYRIPDITRTNNTKDLDRKLFEIFPPGYMHLDGEGYFILERLSDNKGRLIGKGRGTIYGNEITNKPCDFTGEFKGRAGTTYFEMEADYNKLSKVLDSFENGGLENINLFFEKVFGAKANYPGKGISAPFQTGFYFFVKRGDEQPTLIVDDTNKVFTGSSSLQIYSDGRFTPIQPENTGFRVVRTSSNS